MANGTKQFSVEDPREEIHVDELFKVIMNRRTEKVIYLCMTMTMSLEEEKKRNKRYMCMNSVRDSQG